MTFSLIARCERTGQFGVAAATGAMAVGKLVSYAGAGTGAVATQAFVNPYLGIDAIKLTAAGKSAQEVVDELLSRDPEPHKRQLAVIDRQGRTAAHSGDAIAPWFGHRHQHGLSAQGNRLVGPQVLDAMVEAFSDEPEEDLAQRLMRGVIAGWKAGGDAAGDRSATLLVYDTEEYPLWDIRVDDNENPFQELQRLFDKFRVELLPKIRRLPTRADARDGMDPAGGGIG